MRNDLPMEAASIDGQFIEDAIPGYMTIMTQGRESLAPDLDSYSVGTADGERIRSSRYPARTITVDFYLQADSMPDLRDKLNHLNNLLSMDEADFIFNDEDDKFFTGIPMIKPDRTDYKNAIKGSFEIYCAYPFKRSVAVYEASPTQIDETSVEFTIAYGGNYPARPVLRAEFSGALSGGDHSEDGDCGFVVFVDDSKNVIQVGNPDALDLDAQFTASQLINRTLTTLNGWILNGGASWGNKLVAGSLAANQSITDANWKKGAGHTLKCVKPSYGTGSSWHGPIMRKSFADGFINFDIAIVHMLCATANTQVGSFEAGVYRIEDSIYKMTCGVVIEKTASGTKGIVRYIVDGKQVGAEPIDLSKYNTNFGFCNKTATYKMQWYNKREKKWQSKKIKKAKTRKARSGHSYTQSNLNTSIRKSGSTVTFKVGNLKARSFTAAGIKDVLSSEISMFFGQRGTRAPLNTNAVSSIKLTRLGTPAFSDCPNVFTAGDVVEADCNDASVYILREGTEEGHLAPEYGALGNDWEDFTLQKGTNIVAATWSDWVNPAYKPALKILYNEVFI